MNRYYITSMILDGVGIALSIALSGLLLLAVLPILVLAGVFLVVGISKEGRRG